MNETTYRIIEKTREAVKGILIRDEESICLLMKSLVIIGIMMSFAGSSRPASGSEHHFAHYFEITGLVHDKSYLPHGTDVLYSSVITAKIRENILKQSFPDKQYRVGRDKYLKDMKNIYGFMADGCVALQDKSGLYADDKIEIYKSKENEIRRILSKSPKSYEIIKIIEEIGYDMKNYYEFYGEEKIKKGIVYAKDLKNRYTFLWLNYDLFGGII